MADKDALLQHLINTLGKKLLDAKKDKKDINCDKNGT